MWQWQCDGVSRGVGPIAFMPWWCWLPVGEGKYGSVRQSIVRAVVRFAYKKAAQLEFDLLSPTPQEFSVVSS